MFDSTAKLLITQEINKICGKLEKTNLIQQFLNDKKSNISQAVIEPDSASRYIPLKGTDYTLKVVGRANALVFDKFSESKSPIVMQVKNRAKKLLNQIPSYELIQVYVYMWLYKSKRCFFRERYASSHQSTEVNMCSFHDIEEKLQDFGNSVVEAIQNTEINKKLEICGSMICTE